MMKYKLFGNTGLRVSELCLGTMTFGTEWGSGADEAESHKIFEAFVQAGGNFFDTANRYTEGTSEKFLGKFMGQDREKYVVATKYTLYDDLETFNFSGNGRKNMMRSVEDSLKRLNTDYIDLLWIHMWDFTTPVEEVMRGFDDLISQGKVHHIGFSDTPAWVVAQAHTMAQHRSWAPVNGIQVEYSLIQRSPEAELLPMAKEFGLAITPWSPLGAGLLTGKYNDKLDEDGRLLENSVKYSESNLKIARKVTEVAEGLGQTAPQVAVNWIRQQHQQMIPIIGARTEKQLIDTLGCLDFEILETQMQELNEISRIPLGFPSDFTQNKHVKRVIFGETRDRLDNHRPNSF